MRNLLFLILIAVVGTAGCDQPTESEPEAAGPSIFTAYDEDAEALLSEMTLDEKIGQMIQADNEFIEDPADVATYHLGSVLSGGNSDPEEGNTLEAWTDMYDRYQEQALETRLGIPILYGVDAVHGHNNVLGAVVFPHNIGLGATRDADLVERIARVTAREVRATGINWTFAPAVSVPRDERWGRTYEGFSEDPELVSELGEAAIRGYQSGDLSDPLSVLACAKHYLGDGGTEPGTAGEDGTGLDQGDMTADSATVWDVHLFPYHAAVEEGVGTIMPSYSSWNGEKMSGSEYLLTDVLKGELGFEGFLISDYRAIDQLDPDYKTAIEKSVNAGMDMGMVPSKYKEFFTLLKELVEEERVPMSRIDDAVRRILRVKLAMGLMEEDANVLADRELHEAFGSQAHRDVAREAVRKSLVLLKNEAEALPIASDVARIHVAGTFADDIGNQVGGWTITWQGESGDVTPGGTTILEAIRNAAAEATEVTFSEDGTGAEGADIAVVVVGEAPYAEMFGDREDLRLDDEALATIRNVEQAGVPVAVVLISGRPLIIDDALDLADAFVAAWLPGTEGQGVADVLFGDYAPTGKLSYTWPRSMDQIPINVGDEEYDPLFEFGYGLTY